MSTDNQVCPACDNPDASMDGNTSFRADWVTCTKCGTRWQRFIPTMFASRAELRRAIHNENMRVNHGN